MPFLHCNRRNRWASLLMTFIVGKHCFLTFYRCTERLLTRCYRYFINCARSYVKNLAHMRRYPESCNPPTLVDTRTYVINGTMVCMVQHTPARALFFRDF
jgi:hypothetical protein